MPITFIGSICIILTWEFPQSKAETHSFYNIVRFPLINLLQFDFFVSFSQLIAFLYCSSSLCLLIRIPIIKLNSLRGRFVALPSYNVCAPCRPCDFCTFFTRYLPHTTVFLHIYPVFIHSYSLFIFTSTF